MGLIINPTEKTISCDNYYSQPNYFQFDFFLQNVHDCSAKDILEENLEISEIDPFNEHKWIAVRVRDFWRNILVHGYSRSARMVRMAQQNIREQT